MNEKPGKSSIDPEHDIDPGPNLDPEHDIDPGPNLDPEHEIDLKYGR